MGGGVLRIPDAAAQLGLPAAGERQPDLLSALAALADFRYTYLYATVSLNAAGGLDLALTLEGSNPAVQEGEPLTLTLAFGIDLADLLAAFRYGREIGPELFDGAWSLK
ncbi:MAG: YdbH domain-containing protein [Rhodospirillales bacterium]|nr:YdbH domain-containing protein [Rhodospirillales bacterium]